MKGFEGRRGFCRPHGRPRSGEKKYHLVRTRKILGRPTALYRNFDTKNRMGYSEFIAGPDADGKARSSTSIITATTNTNPKSVAAQIISQAARENAEFAKTLTEEQRLYSEHEKEIENWP